MTQITLAMGYIPSVQFAPFYVAQARGYFRDAGLDVTFRYGFESDLLKLVGTNELQFMIGSGEEVILGRSQGLPVRYVMRWYRRFPVVLFAKAEQGIKSPADLVGKRVGLPGLFGASYVGWEAIVYASGLDASKVTLQSIGFTQAAAVSQGQVDAALDYVVNGPVQLRLAGAGGDGDPGCRLRGPALQRHHHQRQDHQGESAAGAGPGDGSPARPGRYAGLTPMRRSTSA